MLCVSADNEHSSSPPSGGARGRWGSEGEGGGFARNSDANFRH